MIWKSGNIRKTRNSRKRTGENPEEIPSMVMDPVRTLMRTAPQKSRRPVPAPARYWVKAFLRTNPMDAAVRFWRKIQKSTVIRIMAALANSVTIIMGSESRSASISVSACRRSPPANCFRMLLSARTAATPPMIMMTLAAMEEIM